MFWLPSWNCTPDSRLRLRSFKLTFAVRVPRPALHCFALHVLDDCVRFCLPTLALSMNIGGLGLHSVALHAAAACPSATLSRRDCLATGFSFLVFPSKCTRRREGKCSRATIDQNQLAAEIILVDGKRAAPRRGVFAIIAFIIALLLDPWLRYVPKVAASSLPYLVRYA